MLYSIIIRLLKNSIILSVAVLLLGSLLAVGLAGCNAPVVYDPPFTETIFRSNTSIVSFALTPETDYFAVTLDNRELGKYDSGGELLESYPDAPLSLYHLQYNEGLPSHIWKPLPQTCLSPAQTSACR